MKYQYILCTVFVAVLQLLTSNTYAQKTTDPKCQQYILAKLTITNKTLVSINKLTFGYRFDGKEQGTFQWEGNLAPNQTSLVALPILPIVKGMNTYSIYIQKRSKEEIALDWADYEALEDQKIIAKEVLEKRASKTADHKDDCNCLKAADKTFAQVNLWFYQTGSHLNDTHLLGSINKGAHWKPEQKISPEIPCSDTEFSFENQTKDKVRVLVAQNTDVLASYTTEETDKSESLFNMASLGNGMMAYPNPFQNHTTLQYTLEEASEVALTVFNVLGQKIITLVNKEQQQQGRHTVTFKPKGIPKGIYLLRLTTSKGSRSIQIIFQ